MKIGELRDLSVDELHARERELTDEIFHLPLAPRDRAAHQPDEAPRDAAGPSRG